jgi:hypothetical protein
MFERHVKYQLQTNFLDREEANLNSPQKYWRSPHRYTILRLKFQF